MTQAISDSPKTLLEALGQIVGTQYVLSDPEETRVYECDALTLHKALPMAVVLPGSEQEIIEILALCRSCKVPIVPRGAGTGISGGVRPIEGGIVLVLTRMSRILDLDPDGPHAIVEPGVRNLAISEAALVHGLFYAPDPSSQIACTIGGNVSENAGGVHCLKYGLTLHNVLGIRGILVDGSVVELGGLGPDAPGLDLLPLVIGSEGTLLIVTRVTVRLLPRPEVARLAMASFDAVGTCADAVSAIIAKGIIPAGLEMMDRGAIEVVEDFVRCGYDLDAEAILLVESDGVELEVREEMARIEHILKDCGARSVRIAETEEERLKFWSGRKSAFPAAGRAAREYYCMDGTVPRRAMASLLSYIQELERAFSLRCINVFHAGDGNMHPLILFDGRHPGEAERAEAFGQKILLKCVELGGTVTGEHGVGIEKLDSLCVQFGDDERHVFHEFKAVFDPPRLLNPDKGIPSLHRCIEVGRQRNPDTRAQSLGLEHF